MNGDVTQLIIRRETAADHHAVDTIHRGAFAHPDLDHGEPPVEVALCQNLRTDDGFIPELSLVAERAGIVVGHVITTRGSIAESPSLGLGPIGIDPTLQRSGIGSALMRASIGAADALGEQVILLLGSTDWYPRFGFVPAHTIGVISPDAVWGDHFQALPLSCWDGTLAGYFRYAAPFGDL